MDTVDIISKNKTFFKLGTVIVDILLIVASYLLAFKIRFKGGDPSRDTFDPFINALPYICVVAVILLYIYGMYSILHKTVWETLLTIVLITVILTIISMAVTFFIRGFGFPRTVFAYGAILQVILLSIWRTLILKVRRRLHGKQSILIIGHGQELEEAARKIIMSAGHLYEVRYLFDLQKDFKLARKLINDVEHVFICSDLAEQDKSKIFSYCVSENKNMFIIPDLFEISIKNASLYQFDDIPLFRVQHLTLTSEQKLIKRIFDLIVSGVAIIITAPIMLIITIAIKISSPGPVLFKQERVTEGNRTFNVYKFRTMVKDAEKLTGPVLASEKDPRITPIGHFLRSTRLDELPQFFNVFLGHMSIVGPRPERPYFVERFTKDMPDFEYRVSVKAGITGLAQVLGKYTTTPQDKLRYDLLYIRNYSFWLDIKLILQTIKIVFVKESSIGLKDDMDFDSILKELSYKKVLRKGYIELQKS
ncbi:exopolysaccharide biosynthesis polyprenyl glycosylphosphotransferase [Defluviitalea raffinosedens]|uniref:Exopolysaccharide biosynthesis polyprenyl glycosylphosphotransferase n=1 Tax=Defluviitalea raffinosedens TaxID=1450156 RepID=A0A7C8HG31_9FIRM|nr:exopolysaccharide biosynthesis polyprenyl glycosylphosphotransferase [Defluviitalea raffinosedens]